MVHAYFEGTHYGAGFRWGSLLLKHKNKILENLPFPITRERMDFAASCLPVYEEYYPEILEEIQGLADGQRCDARILKAMLLGMYAMPPSCGCSCFALANEQSLLLGRNSDFVTDLEKLNLNVIYKLTDGAYSFTGNTTAFVEIEDGVNEHGLAAGLTSVYPRQRKPGLNAGFLLRYLLEKCKDVPQAVARLSRLPAASAQTLTLADASGRIAVIEWSPERFAFAQSLSEKRAFACATNAFHLPEMTSWNCPGIDDWFSDARYQTLTCALQKDRDWSPAFAKKLLSGDYGFLCQYDRNTGKDTVWSVLYDLKDHKIHLCEGNPMRHAFKEDSRFQF